MSEDEIISEILSMLYENIEKHITLDAFENTFYHNFPNNKDYRVIFDNLMEENLMEKTPLGLKITYKGQKIIKKYGSYLTYLSEMEDKEQELRRKKLLELDSLKSNIETNKINKSTSKRNLPFTIINIIIGILTAILLAWQLYIAAKK